MPYYDQNGYDMVMIWMLHGESYLVHFEQDNEQDSEQVVKTKLSSMRIRYTVCSQFQQQGFS